MSDEKSYNDVGFDASGQVIAIGDEARAQQTLIVDHPDATLVLVVAVLNGDLGIRTFGPPSLELAEVLDRVAAEYRVAVTMALGKPQG